MADRLDLLDHRLSQLSHSIEGARAAYRHSPNPETRRMVDRLYQRADELLDLRLTYRAEMAQA